MLVVATMLNWIRVIAFELIAFLALGPLYGSDGAAVLFAGATLSDARFSLATVIQTEINTINALAAGYACAQKPWCSCYCQLSDKRFVLTDIIASAGALDTEPGILTQCYTRRINRNVFPRAGTSISSVATAFGFANRMVSNFMDGVYSKDIDECYSGRKTSSVLVDFGAVVKLRHVVVVLQPKGSLNGKFSDVYITVGNVVDNDAIVGGQLMEHYVNPFLVHGQEITLGSGVEFEGRYVSVNQDRSSDFQFCHLEVCILTSLLGVLCGGAVG